MCKGRHEGVIAKRADSHLSVNLSDPVKPVEGVTGRPRRAPKSS